VFYFSIEKVVEATLQKAFWDILELELNEDPPKYNQALLLLEEVKAGLTLLLLPQHKALKQKIDEVLDLELIKQQADKGTLHLQVQYTLMQKGYSIEVHDGGATTIS